jgi:hypothetical protein
MYIDVFSCQWSILILLYHTHAPLTTNPGSAPEYYLPFWLFSPRCYQQIFVMGFSTLKTSFGLNLINTFTFCILIRNRQGYKVERKHDQ